MERQPHETIWGLATATVASRTLHVVVAELGMESFSASLGHLEHSVRTGEAAFGLVEPDGLFAHLQRNESEARIFDAAMTAKAAGDIAAALAAYDFSRF